MSSKVTKQSKKEIGKFIILVTAVIVVNIILSNLSAVSMIFKSGDKKEIDLKKEFGSSEISVSKNNPITINNIDTELYNICIETAGDDFSYKDVEISFTDDNFRFDDAYDYNKLKQLIAVGDDSVSYIDVCSFGKAGAVRIACDDNITIKSITLNKSPGFSFSLVWFIVLFGVTVCVVYGTWRAELDKDSFFMIKVVAGLLCILVICITGTIHSKCDADLLMEIPKNVTGEDQYTQLFDAIHKKQNYLDIDFSEEDFAELDCPYDRSERNEKNPEGDFWDRAYYDGKMYSYFGTAPIFTVYYPIYMFTHRIPTPLFASEILCLYCIIFMSLLYELLLKHFCKDIPREMALLGLIALIFGSVIFPVALETKFYYIAVLSGVSSVSAFFYFLFSAYFARNKSDKKKRVIFLVLAGISVVAIVASRPTLVLYCFIALIPAWYIFSDKKESLKNKIHYSIAIGVPIVTGAIMIMAYNYARFDNPFEFGFNYQLTVSRAAANTIKLSMIPAAIYHYFIQQPQTISSFPYLKMTYNGFDSYERYSYHGITMGVLMYPASWGVFADPFTLKLKSKDKDEKFKSLIILSLSVMVVLMAFIDMCKAGSHYRYTTDISFVLILVSLINIIDVSAMFKKANFKFYKYYYAIVSLLMIITIFVGGLLAFNNETHNMLKAYDLATRTIRIFI